MTDDDLIEAIRVASGYALHREAARRVLDVIRPKGWRVVPEKLTAAMLAAAAKGISVDYDGSDEAKSRLRAAVLSWADFLSAAPTPPLPEIKDEDQMMEISR